VHGSPPQSRRALSRSDLGVCCSSSRDCSRLKGKHRASTACPADTGCRRLLTALCAKYVPKSCARGAPANRPSGWLASARAATTAAESSCRSPDPEPEWCRPWADSRRSSELRPRLLGSRAPPAGCSELGEPAAAVFLAACPGGYEGRAREQPGQVRCRRCDGAGAYLAHRRPSARARAWPGGSPGGLWAPGPAAPGALKARECGSTCGLRRRRYQAELAWISDS
jgi:hypothetical protein